MNKRKFSEIGDDKSTNEIIKNAAKHTLDSDEEDDEDENDRYALQDDDIEGQEDGGVGYEEGVQITPFNMTEELEEGHFDKDGMYHWKKEKVVRDNWLENVDWIKVKQSEDATALQNLENEDELPEAVDTIQLYIKILEFLQPKENIAQALKRLGGNRSLSASERLKLKKAGKLPSQTNDENSQKVIELTELANKILTSTGNMDIYQETYEYISEKVSATSPKKKVKMDAGLDMYADDFDEKEKERLSGVDSQDNKEEETSSTYKEESSMWEYKEKEDSAEIKGPYSTEQMAKWASTGHFGSGVLVRKCGSQQFYTSNRVDFELYI